jgi:capsular exopolysaccharide synthesis family protein
LIEVQVKRYMLSAAIKAAEEDLRTADEAGAAHDEAAAKALAAQQSKKEKEKRVLSKDDIELRDELVEMKVEEDAEVRQLDSRLTAYRDELELKKKLVKKDQAKSFCADLVDEIARCEKDLEALKGKLKPRIQKQVELSMRTGQREGGISGGFNSEGSMLARRRDELSRLRTELRGCELAEGNLREAYNKRLKDLLQQREQLSNEKLNLKFKKDELAQKQMVLTKITERQVALLTERSAPPRVIWHEEAKPPQAPIEILPYRNMSLAALVAFCLPFALAVGWEARARRIGGSEDLEQQLHLAVLGEIARLPTRGLADSKVTAARIGADLRVFQESIDSLRTALTLSDDLRDMRILAITSAANHEGKTSVATQLALSLARASGKATLLIDGDMRSPDVHEVFGLPQEPGLAEVLGDECKLADAIVATHNPNVHLLPAGKLKVSPHRLLGNGSWKSLIEQVPSSYRYVIIDTPPVLAASEALVLTKSADAVLMCVMRDVSRADQVRKASHLLETAGGRPIGTVLNGVPTRSYEYSHGTYPLPSGHSLDPFKNKE